MFKRRNAVGIFSRVRQFIWPSMGFARLSRYMRHRLGRMQGSPYSIAAGFACGAAASFTPFIGFHFILAGLLAWLIRANILASAIGTVIGNPWTFPFIWFWTFKVGNWVLGSPDGMPPPQLSVDMILDVFSGGSLGHSMDLLVPMLVGGLITGGAVWILSYLPLAGIIAAYRRQQVQRRADAAARKAAAATFTGAEVSEQGAGSQ